MSPFMNFSLSRFEERQQLRKTNESDIYHRSRCQMYECDSCSPGREQTLFMDGCHAVGAEM